MGPIFDTGLLPRLRGRGDPVADGVVAGLLADAPAADPEDTLVHLLRCLRDLDENADVAAWIGAVETPPPWLDVTLMARGQEFFADWSLDIVTSLFCASLPFAYAAAQGVEVLERASLLADPRTVARRIAETGQMLLDVGTPRALAPGARGYRTARTVRLLHAVIRARLTLDPGAPGDPAHAHAVWDTAELGVPVNQEDLLGTLLSFTTVVFRAFENMGIPPAKVEREAYLALWGAIGALLGIEYSEAVLRPDKAEELTDVIAKRLHAGSKAGVHLMEVLMDEMELSMPWGMRKLPRTLVRHLGGDQVADMLGVEESAWWGALLPVLAALNRLTRRVPAGRAILQAPSRLLGRSVIRMWVDRNILGEGSTHVHIDPSNLARLGIRRGPGEPTVGLRGRLRGVRRRARLRQRRRLASAAQAATTGPAESTAAGRSRAW